MWHGFIGKHIQRSDRNLLLANAGLLLGTVAIGFSTARYWHNFFSGPLPMAPQALTAIQDPDRADRYFVTVQGEKTIDTGFEQITQRKNKYSGTVTSETVSAKYVALIVNKKLLIVKANVADAAHTQFTGALTQLSAKVQQGIVDDAVARNPKLKAIFLPYMLEETDFRTPGYIGLAVGLPLLALSLWNLQKVLRRRDKPEQHPIAKALAVKGAPETVVSQVEQEVQSSFDKATFGSTTLTKSWLFRPTFFGLNVTLLDQLVWVYKKVTTHRTYGIPLSKSWAAIVCDRNGHTLEIPFKKEQQVDEFLQSILKRVPWVVGGHSDDLQKLWNKERSKLIEAVDQRRQAA